MKGGKFCRRIRENGVCSVFNFFFYNERVLNFSFLTLPKWRLLERRFFRRIVFCLFNIFFDIDRQTVRRKQETYFFVLSFFMSHQKF